MNTCTVPSRFALIALVACLSGCVQPPGSDDSRVFASSAYSSSPYGLGEYSTRRMHYGGYLGTSYEFYDRGYRNRYGYDRYYASHDQDHDHAHSREDTSRQRTRASSGSGSRSSPPSKSSPNRRSDIGPEARQSRGSSNNGGQSRSGSGGDEKRQSRGRS